MPKKAGILFTVAGAVLVLAALLLFIFNQYEDYYAGREAELLLDDILAAIEETKPSAFMPITEEAELVETAFEAYETEVAETLYPEMPAIEINGYEYIGYLSIPELELELPVMSDWDYNRLKIAPCRQFGSSRTDDLVIAAHNYKRHFGKLSTVKIGTEVKFTDMDGIENLYTVKSILTLKADSVDEVQNSGYDLVLYTCTSTGATRVAVFCNRAEN